MKKLLTILTITAVIFAACSKTKQLHKRLTGKWNIATKDLKFNYNNFPSIVQTYSCSGKGSIELKSDGTGTFNDPVDSNGTISTFNITDWYNDDLHVTILCKDQNLDAHQISFDVQDNQKESQKWYTELNEMQIAGKVNVKATYTLALAK